MSIFLNTLFLFGVIGLCTLGPDYQGDLSGLGMSIFVNTSYWFGVVGLCTLGLHWGVHLYWVGPHFSIAYTG